MLTISALCLLLPMSIATADAKQPTSKIAPFLDEQTFVVVRIDVEKINIDSVLAALKRIAPEERDSAKLARVWLDALDKSGAKEVFVAASLSDPWGQAFGVIPLGKDRDQALEPALASLPKPLTQRRHRDVLLIGSPVVLDRLTAAGNQPTVAVESAFAAIKDAAVQVIVLAPPLLRRSVREIMPQLPAKLGAGSTEVIDRGFRWGAIGVDLPPRESIRIVIQAEDADAAKAFNTVLQRSFTMLARYDELKTNLAAAAELLPLLAPKTANDQVLLQLTQEQLAKALNPALDKARAAARRTQTINNLRQLAIAMHGYNDVHKTFPPAANHDANGEPLLSWRVHLLPFLDQLALYQEFRLNEPWDSAHNKKLIERMPAVFRSPLLKTDDRFTTTYLVPTGKNSIFAGGRGTKFAEITDGSSNTILLVEAADPHAVIWTKPDDLDSEAKDVPARLLRPEVGGFLAAMADGSVRVLPQTLDRATLQALFMRNDGKAVNVP